MEVPGPGERLADQLAAHHLAVPLDERAVGLAGEEHPGEPGHQAGVGEPGEDAEQQRQDDGGSNLRADHGQTSPRATRIMSMSLMPTNGTTSPPRP